MNEHEHKRELNGEDRQLVNLATAALVDPNLTTDRRMRLHREITELLLTTHEDLYGPGGHKSVVRSVTTDEGLQKLLEAVLADPNLHTDLRMRLHSEIPELVRAARKHAGAHR